MHKEALEPGTFTSYSVGFIVCIVLTLAAYFAVEMQWFSRGVTIFAIVSLGVIQLLVQLVCFLHLGSEDRPQWNLLVFLFMLLVIVVIVGGSLWIMDNLDYRVM